MTEAKLSGLVPDRLKVRSARILLESLAVQTDIGFRAVEGGAPPRRCDVDVVHTRYCIALEYAVHGRAVGTRNDYDNHFVSVITIENRKVVRWRDYLDPVAVFDALGWPPAP